MRKVYITEEQYISFIINECYNNGLIDESLINSEKIKQLLFYGCENFDDFKRRVKKIALYGTISLGLLISIIKYAPFGNNQEKEDLINDVSIEQTHYKGSESFDISEEGLSHIKSYEKCSLVPYYATKQEKKEGKRTIGWGHVITENDPAWLKKTKSITQQQADDLFRQDIQNFVNEYKRCINKLPNNLKNPQLYTQGWIDAGISMIYNCGMSNFIESPFFQTWSNCRVNPDTNQIDISDYNFTASKIKNSCVVQRGKKVNGLVNRRYKESRMAQI